MATTNELWRVLEVHNFGGFFGGDTVTLTDARLVDGYEETLTIDEKALSNIRDRYCVGPALVLQLEMVGARVDSASLRAAADWATLDSALVPQPRTTDLVGPSIRAYHCRHCELWIDGLPRLQDGLPLCQICDRRL